MLAELAEPEVAQTQISVPAPVVRDPLDEDGSVVRGIGHAVALSLPFWALLGFTFYLVM